MPIFVRSVILSQILFWVGFLGNIGLAIAGPQVFILHYPIQPDSLQPVTYTATASDSNGIKSITISVQHRELQLDKKGQTISVLVEETLETHSYNPPFTQSETFTVTNTAGYPDNSHIGYKATVTSGAGETGTDGYIYFAAGAFPSTNDPIPIYVHEGDTAAKIDLVFIPDEDYGQTNWEQGFMNDVTDLIQNAFFSDKPFARMIRNRHEMWNFYITYYQGDAASCISRSLPINWATLAATVNSGFIVHKEIFNDCSGIGEGSTFSAEPIDLNNERSQTVPIHEIGHSVFSLADEYSGGYFFESLLPSHNVFKDYGTCTNNAAAHGWPEKDCKKIRRTNWYRSDGNNDIMEDTSSTDNAPGRSDEKRIEWHYGQCTNNQNC